MRVTIDRDCYGVGDMLITILRGWWVLHRPPDYIVRSSGGRGFHYVWHKAAKDWDDCIRKRRAIGDDSARVGHDLRKRKGFKQVLFTKKKVDYYGAE